MKGLVVDGIVLARQAGNTALLETTVGAERFALAREAYGQPLPSPGDRVRLQLNAERDIVGVTVLDQH